MLLEPARLSDEFVRTMVEGVAGVKGRVTIGGEGCEPCDYLVVVDVDGVSDHLAAIVPLDDEALDALSQASAFLVLRMYGGEVAWSLEVGA